jgi:uncharacterized membrane protein HdeD (DUF308 family)
MSNDQQPASKKKMKTFWSLILIILGLIAMGWGVFFIPTWFLFLGIVLLLIGILLTVAGSFMFHFRNR